MREALKVAEEIGCHHIMWSPQYCSSCGYFGQGTGSRSYCCHDDGENGPANANYEVYAVPSATWWTSPAPAPTHLPTSSGGSTKRPSPAPSVSPTPAPSVRPTPATTPAPTYLANDWWKQHFEDGKIPAGTNLAAPAGYVAIEGAGPCMCRGGGHNLDSCGTLCCYGAPYTDPDPNGQYYIGKSSNGRICYKPEPLAAESPTPAPTFLANDWWKQHFADGKIPSGTNLDAPLGYVAIEGAGPCMCRGGGWNLDSCGKLCCRGSPYTDPDPNGQYQCRSVGACVGAYEAT